MSALAASKRRRPTARAFVHRHPALTEPIVIQPPHYAEDVYVDELLRSLLWSPLPEYLRYEDRSSMAQGLEARFPFLDHRIGTWAITHATELSGRSLSKAVLRAAAPALLPEVVRLGRQKVGFAVPPTNTGALRSWAEEHCAYAVDVAPVNLKEIRRLLHQPSRFGHLDPFLWRTACVGAWQARAM